MSLEIMSLKFIFFCPLMRLQFQLRGGGRGSKEWPLRCLNLNLERGNLFIMRSNLKEHLSKIVADLPQVATKNILRQEGS